MRSNQRDLEASMQSSTFGSPSMFGQSQNPGNSQFPSKPFGSATAFGAPTGGSIYAGTSNGAFGATSSSTSSTFLGSSMPAFGASSTPDFGCSSSSFGGSSIFGQKPVFGASSTMGSGFSSTPSFGQPTMPAASSSFLGTSQSPFGTHCSSSGESLVGTSAIGPKPFTPLTSSGRSSANAFSSLTTPTFSFPVFKASNTGFSSSPFCTSSLANSFTPTFGPNSSPSSFGPSSSPGFTSSPPIFNSTTRSSINPFSSSTPTFKPNSSPPPFVPSSKPTFASSPSIFNSITPSSINPFSSSIPTFQPGSSPSVFGPSSSPAFASSRSIFNSTTPSSTNPFSSLIPSNIFRPNSTVSLFSPSTSPAFSSSPSIFNSTTPSSTNPLPTSIPSNPFGPNSSVSLFGPSSSPAFSSSPSISSSTSAPKTAFAFKPNSFSSISPAVSLTPYIFSSTEWGTKNSPSPFASTPSISSSTSAPTTNTEFSSGSSFAFTQSSPLFSSIATSTGASFLTSKPNAINSSSTGSLHENYLFSCIPSQISTSTVAPPGQTIPAQTAQTRGSSGAGGVTGGIGQSTAAQEFVTKSSAEMQPPSVVNPFGTLPAMPQPAFPPRGSTPSLQYGISSIPVSDKQAPVRTSSSLTIRHLSQRRNRLPVQKYDPKSNGLKVPFFSEVHDEIPTPAFVPRENPRALVIHPSEHGPLRVNLEKFSPLKRSSIRASYENSQDDVEAYAPVLDGSIYQDENGKSDKNNTGKACATEEAATVYKHTDDLTALMPKLHKCSDYYTEPEIQDLASKERAETGFISRVKDFVIGRYGYGSIKFPGSTDVRQLDLESLIQFNNKEVIVYPDETKKHPVGQGLNKPAEVTLLNIKCIDKKTGKQFIDGPKADKYKEMLTKKATDQGAEFMSYDPVEGEWKFRVQHFN